MTVGLPFVLHREHASDRAKQAVMVEPPDPLQGGGIDIVEPPSRPAPPDYLRLVQSDDRLGQGVSCYVSWVPD